MEVKADPSRCQIVRFSYDPPVVHHSWISYGYHVKTPFGCALQQLFHHVFWPHLPSRRKIGEGRVKNGVFDVSAADIDDKYLWPFFPHGVWITVPGLCQ